MFQEFFLLKMISDLVDKRFKFVFGLRVFVQKLLMFIKFDQFSSAVLELGGVQTPETLKTFGVF